VPLAEGALQALNLPSAQTVTNAGAQAPLIEDDDEDLPLSAPQTTDLANAVPGISTAREDQAAVVEEFGGSGVEEVVEARRARPLEGPSVGFARRAAVESK
jgi:hypothetical protein